MKSNSDTDLFNFDLFLDTKLTNLKMEGRYREFIDIEKNIDTFPKFNYSTKEGRCV